MDFVLVVDKPAGLTSHDVVARARRALREKRIGHTGTLDPFATGVLVLLVRRATRLAQFLSGAEKEYEALVRFGYATDTGDCTGQPIESAPGLLEPTGAWTGSAHLEPALESLRGRIEQVPPMYSAKKVKGERLYEIARRGESIERKAVWVNIHQLEAFERGGTLFSHNPDGTVDLGIRVVCSAGTYIRTLAEALGERLGKPAHLAALRRIRAGRFRIGDTVSLEKLGSLVDQSHLSLPLLSPDAALSDMPFQHLTVGDALRTRHGAAIAADPQIAQTWADGERVRLRDEHGNLIAVGRYDRRNESLKPEVVIDLCR